MTNPTGQFRQHTIRQKRKDGSIKTRELAIPDDETAQKHRRMLHLLYQMRIPMPHATAALPGKTLLDNVEPHRSSNHFYMVDLTNAFPSVNKDRLLAIAGSHIIPTKQRADVQDFISNWATSPDVPGLPLGAPASPLLFNLYCLPLDQRLGRLCGDNGIRYTRYLDDLTFSSRYPIGKRNRSHLRDVIHHATGMTINHAKSHVHSLADGPVTITGVSLYPDRHLAASPTLLETASQTFRGVGQRAMQGELVYDNEVGQLHGYFGAVEQLSDPEATVTHRLFREYRTALGQLGISGGGQKHT